MNNNFKLTTEKGYFDVMTSMDETYPGIDIEFISPENEKNVSRPRIVFEYTENKKLRVLIWDDSEKEDYTKEIIF